jgi:CRP/FNR family cyclic AMP-dependent transcriptional regulator
VKSISDLLAEHPFFSTLSPEDLDLLAGCGTNYHFKPDQQILVANDPADFFYVLRSGKVAVEIDTPGRGPIVIETIGAGDILGVSWLLPPYRSSFDARAVEPTRAVGLDATCIRKKCDEDPVLGYELFKRFAGLIRNRLTATRMQVLDLYSSHDS